MELYSNIYNKNGLTVMHIARKLLAKQPGERIENIVTIAAELQVGRGTVQKALRSLEEMQAISLESRGHLGTYIMDIDYAALLRLSGMSHLVGVMPLPYSKRYEGLATGLYNTLNREADIHVSLAFMPGSDRRINSLLECRYNFAVVSRGTAEHCIGQNDMLEIIYTFSERTYVNSHAFITRSDYTAGEDGMRIGIDKYSFDQTSITKQYFQDKSVEFIPMKYSSIIENIKNNKIDGGIWSIEDAVLKDAGLKYVPLPGGSNHKNTQAAMLIRKDDEGTRNFLNRFFDKEGVERIQKAVLNNEMLPNF